MISHFYYDKLKNKWGNGMGNMKEKLKEYFNAKDYFIKLDDLKKNLRIKGEEQTNSFYSALKELVEDGCLFFDAKKGYKLFTNDLGCVYGQIEISKTGTGFIHTKDGHIIYVQNEDLNGALDGDLVIVSSITFGKKSDYKGEVSKVLKRKTGNVVFEVIGTGEKASLVPYHKNEIVPININKNELRKLVDGEIILVNVGTEKNDGAYVATITEVIGNKNDANLDIMAIYAKNNVPVKFSKEALEEADKLPTEVSEEEIKDMIDLRDYPFLTIDCDGTKDRDDAICAKKLPNGNIKVYIAISRVNYYIKRGSKLYEEALQRVTSYYPDDTCNPLFPPKVSNGICSLNEGVDRLVKVVEKEYTPEGKVVDYNIYNAVINSKKEMKYSEVDKVLAGEKVDGYISFKEQLELLKDLNHNILEPKRVKRNCIDYELHDIERTKDENGNTKGFETRGEGISYRIIENCMIEAGMTIAEHYSWFPLIYRIQELPDPKKLENAIKILRLSGFSIPKVNNINEETINSILQKIRGKEEAYVVRTLLLKSTKKARYSTLNLGHFALQLKQYCHFTAPIRRITDFIVHTIIDEIETFNYTDENISLLENDLKQICESASYKERLAKSIDDEVLAMNMAEYMEPHIGEERNAMITEVNEHGMFVRTKDNIIGKIKFENMEGDYFYYTADKNAIIGKNTKKKYQIGNKVCVIVKSACKDTRSVDFGINKQKSLRK